MSLFPGNIKEIILLNTVRWQKHLWELKYWKFLLMDMSSATAHHANAKTTISSWFSCKKKKSSHTDKPGGHEGLRENGGFCFIHSVWLRCKDGVMWRERRKRVGGAYHLWIQHPCFFQASFLIFSLFCTAVSSEVLLVIRYRSVRVNGGRRTVSWCENHGCCAAQCGGWS